MSNYRDFPKDFLKRTQDNVNNYSGKYEFTNLINNCLGLIVIPKELLIDNLTEYTFSESDKKYGISKQNIKIESKSDYSLNNIVRHIRNGLSHGRIEQETVDDTIKGIRIYDAENKNSNDNFSIEMTVNELKDFAFLLSNDFIKE